MALKSGPTQRRVRDGAGGGAARVSRIQRVRQVGGDHSGASGPTCWSRAIPEQRLASTRFWNVSSQGGSLEILSDTRLLLLQEIWGVCAGRASCARELCQELRCGCSRGRDCRQRCPWRCPCEPSPAPPRGSCSRAAAPGYGIACVETRIEHRERSMKLPRHTCAPVNHRPCHGHTWASGVGDCRGMT